MHVSSLYAGGTPGVSAIIHDFARLVSLFVSQRFDWVEPRGAPCREKAEAQANGA